MASLISLLAVQSVESTVPSANATTQETGTVAAAVTWATHQKGSTSWNGDCLGFVRAAYTHAGVTIGGPAGEAVTAYQWWQAHTSLQHAGADISPPAGALVFWAPNSYSSAGHVALSLGNGQAISTEERSYNDVHTFAIADRNNTSPGYTELGWIWPPGVAGPPTNTSSGTHPGLPPPQARKATTSSSTIGATMVGSDGDGHGVRTTFSFGKVELASRVNADALADCSLNADRSAAVEVTLHTDATSSASEKISFTFDGLPTDPGTVEFVMNYSNGSKCFTGASDFSGV